MKLQNTNQIIPYGPTTSRLYSVFSTLVFIHFAYCYYFKRSSRLSSTKPLVAPWLGREYVFTCVGLDLVLPASSSRSSLPAKSLKVVINKITPFTRFMLGIL